MKAALQHVVEDSARVVSDWKTNQAKIQTAIADANARLAKAEAHRARFVLDANLGKPDAIEEVAKARAEHAAALGDLANLGQALGDAKARLGEAEREAANSRNQLARFEAERLIRKRVEVAARIDAISADLASAFGEFENLGKEIMSRPTHIMHHGMVTACESAVGLARVASALPAFVKTLRFDHGMKPEKLEVAEAKFWNLPPEQPAEEKAA